MGGLARWVGGLARWVGVWLGVRGSGQVGGWVRLYSKVWTDTYMNVTGF